MRSPVLRDVAPVALAEHDAERPVGPRSRKGELTRARLVAAAKTVFESSGFLEARITDIAERAGLSHGSFYHYFDSKEEIFREVADALDDRLNAPLNDVIFAPFSQGGMARDRIREGNRAFLTSYRQDALLIAEVEQVSRRDKQLMRARQRHQRVYTERLAVSIGHLIREGLADPGLDPEFTAHVIGAMVTRFADLWLAQGVITSTLDNAVEQLTRLLGNALGLPHHVDDLALPRKRARRGAGRVAVAVRPID